MVEVPLQLFLVEHLREFLDLDVADFVEDHDVVVGHSADPVGVDLLDGVYLLGIEESLGRGHVPRT